MSRPKDFRLTEGTVIDHLPVGTAAQALQLLGLPREGSITVGINVPSARMERKDIVRVASMFLSKSELDRLALLGSKITIGIVRDGTVVEKHVLTVPERLYGVLKCANPTCISNGEPVQTAFARLGAFPYRFRCLYCERSTAPNLV